MSSLERVVLSVDEFEAIRLADFEGFHHEAAAEQMNISRPTFGRVIGSARAKIAKVLAQGLALIIEGGEVEIAEKRFTCHECRHTWDESHGTGKPEECPACRSPKISRAEKPKEAGSEEGCRRKRCRGGHSQTAPGK